MRPCFLTISIGLLLTSADPVHAQARKPAREGWHNDYEVARELARKTGKPLMVVFRCEP